MDHRENLHFHMFAQQSKLRTQADMLMWLVSICVYICVCILHFLPSSGKAGAVGKSGCGIHMSMSVTLVGEHVVVFTSVPQTILSLFSLSIWPGTFVFVQLLLRFAAFRAHFNHICSHSGLDKRQEKNGAPKKEFKCAKEERTTKIQVLNHLKLL